MGFSSFSSGHDGISESLKDRQRDAHLDMQKSHADVSTKLPSIQSYSPTGPWPSSQDIYTSQRPNGQLQYDMRSHPRASRDVVRTDRPSMEQMLARDEVRTPVPVANYASSSIYSVPHTRKLQVSTMSVDGSNLAPRSPLASPSSPSSSFSSSAGSRARFQNASRLSSPLCGSPKERLFGNMKFKTTPSAADDAAVSHSEMPRSQQAQVVHSFSLKASSRPPSFHATLVHRLGALDATRASLDCTGPARQSSHQSPALPAVAQDFNIPIPEHFRASLDVDHSLKRFPKNQGPLKSKLSDPVARPQRISKRWPPMKQEPLSGGRLEMVQQRPAIHSSAAADSFESRHAWYAHLWGHARDDQRCLNLQGPSVSDFDLQFEIGEGLTSKVYLAKIKGAKLMCPDKDDRVVLKAMRKDLELEDESCVEDVAKEEIRMLTSVQKSRHVIRLLGAFESATHVYVAMEWAPCDFFQLMSDHFGLHRYWCNVRIYAAQVLMALEDLHRSGLVYCDLKPENLLVCMDGSVKLSDLGLATPFPKEGERLPRVCGTPEYMSPEMLCKFSGYNHMTDIWSFGVFVHEILTGTTPFKRADGDESLDGIFNQIRKHSTIDVDVKYEVTVEGESFILALLVRDPNRRLGAVDTPGKYNSIREHPWLASLNWRALEKGMNTPSIFPRANRSMYKPVLQVPT